MEGLSEVLDKPLLSDDGVPGLLSFSTRTAGVLTREDILWSLAPTIVEPLAAGPAMGLRREGAADLSPVLRSLHGRRVAVEIDGYRLDSPLAPPGLDLPLAALAPDVVRRAEVIRGANGVTYGHGAMGGSIAVISRRRDWVDIDSTVAAEGGGRFATANNERSGYAQAEVNARDVFGLFGLAASRNLGETQTPGEAHGRTDHHTTNVSASFDSYVGERIVFSANYHRMEQLDVPLDPARRGLLDAQRLHDIGVFALKTRRLSKELRYAQFAVNYGESALERRSGAKDAIEPSRLRAGGVDAILQMRVGPYFGAIYGAEYRRDALDPREASPGTPGLPDGATYERTAVHLTPAIEPNRNLRIAAGARAEFARAEATLGDDAPGDPELAYEDGAFAGDLGARVRVTTHTSVYGGARQGFRFPDLYELAGRGLDEAAAVHHIPAATLSPEIVREAELGYRLHFPFVKGHLAAYHAWLSDIIQARPLPEDPNATLGNAAVVASQNEGRAMTRGIEGSAEFYLGVNWLFALTGSRSFDAVGDAPALSAARPAAGSARLRFMSDGGEFALDILGRFAAEASDLSPADAAALPGARTDAPGYAALDLRASFNFDPYAEVKLGVLNVTNARIIHPGSVIGETGANFVAQAVFRYF
ncbi:TonB-dependent receptor [bacterium]|nr:TonB-dependent receptor [bacterium]